jgi:hypothetical protein
MKPSKPKPAEPSLRDKLSHNFLEAFESDFRTNGLDVIQKLREKSPEKYAEIAARVIAAVEPREPSIENARNMYEVAAALLKSVGFTDPDDNSIEQAIKANDAFIDRLQNIYQCAMASEDEMH